MKTLDGKAALRAAQDKLARRSKSSGELYDRARRVMPGGVTSNIRETAKAFLEDQIDDTLLSSTRTLLIHRNCPAGKEPWNESDSVMSEFYTGFAETLQRLIDQQVARRAKFLAAQEAEKK